eukprot:gene8961-biopygen10820
MLGTMQSSLRRHGALQPCKTHAVKCIHLGKHVLTHCRGPPAAALSAEAAAAPSQAAAAPSPPAAAALCSAQIPSEDQLVLSALQQLQADHILIEQPQGALSASSGPLLLPYPAWIQAAIDYQDELSITKTITMQDMQQPQQQQQQQQQEPQQMDWLLDLQQQVQSLPPPVAQVGRAITDPLETFGFYPGLDFTLQPLDCMTVMQHCGFFPGRELAVAAHHALTRGAALSCIDAPLKLQEPWVKQMLSQVDDRIFEQQMKSYNPLDDLQANDRLLPAAAAVWDAQLAAAARQLDPQHQQQHTQQAAVAQEGPAPAAQMSQEALALYKVSRAAAAAMLLPKATPDVIERLQRLQPLKWAHFTQRQNFMAQQIKEAALTAAAQRRKAAAAAAVASRDPLAGLPPQSSSATSAAAGDTGRPVTLVAVVGRQHVHALQQMWTDKGSVLWRERMPRTFAPSAVEQLAEQLDGRSGQHPEATSNPATADFRVAAAATAAAPATTDEDLATI